MKYQGSDHVATYESLEDAANHFYNVLGEPVRFYFTHPSDQIIVSTSADDNPVCVIVPVKDPAEDLETSERSLVSEEVSVAKQTCADIATSAQSVSRLVSVDKVPLDRTELAMLVVIDVNMERMIKKLSTK